MPSTLSGLATRVVAIQREVQHAAPALVAGATEHTAFRPRTGGPVPPAEKTAPPAPQTPRESSARGAPTPSRFIAVVAPARGDRKRCRAPPHH